MGLVEDDHLVKALFAHRTDPALRISVRSWRSKWRVNDFNALRLEYRIEACAVLPIIVVDKMRERASVGFQFPHQLSCLLAHPELGGMRCYAHDVHTPRADFNEEQDVQRLERDGFHREEIASKQRVLVMVKERTPGCRTSPGWHRRNVMTF